MKVWRAPSYILFFTHYVLILEISKIMRQFVLNFGMTIRRKHPFKTNITGSSG